MIITYLAEKCSHSNISCVATSMETMMTFSSNSFNNMYINLRLFDWYNHLPHPLDELAKNLLNKDTNIRSITSTFPSLFQYFNDKAMKLLRKGVYPYDYMNIDLEKKLKEKGLPNIKYFDSKLNKTANSNNSKKST